VAVNRPVLYAEPHPDDETLLYSSRTPTPQPKPRAEGTLRRRYALRHRLALAACRSGLHFLTWNHQSDAYTCACRRVLLGAEEIR
jgi:hypothetical protein